MTDKDQWMTPGHVVDVARAALGSIELDPATSDEAQQRIRAVRWWTLADDALSRDWRSPSVWLNPPYSGPRPFVAAMVDGWQSGDVRAGLIILTATSAFGTCYGLAAVRAAALVCCPGRVRFVMPGGIVGTAPRDGSVILAGGPGLKIDTAAGALEGLGPVLRA